MPAQFRDYYQTLGVPKTATAEEMKSAFRKLARKFHPDTAKDKKVAEEKFKEINEAYEVLSDPEKRSKYDQLGPDWERGAPPPGYGQPPGGFGGRRSSAQGVDFEFGGTGFSDFFEQMFGGQHGGQRPGGFSPQPQRGENAEADILVTLEEAFHGSTRQISFRRGESGKVETYTVKIPKGIREGQRIRLAGQGGTGAAGGGAGDLFLSVKFQRHPDFEISGSDLLYDLEVPAWDAAIGCGVFIPTLEGRAKLKLPSGTQSGKRFRLPGKGLLASAGQRGDLFAVVAITVPTTMEPEERALWESIAALHKPAD